jgi:hypothetical protein
MQGGFMQPHGNFTLQIKDQVVYARISDGFNEFGIVEYRESVSNLVKNETTWILHNIIADSAGLTPEALEELIITYKDLEKMGCISIAVMKGANNYFGNLLEMKVFEQINIPTVVSVEEIRLSTFLKFYMLEMKSNSV